VRLNMKYLGFEITPISYDRLKVRVVANVDPRMTFIPSWLLNWVVRKLAMGLFEKIITVARNLKGSEFEKHVNDPLKADFYKWLQSKLNEYFKGASIQQ